eukprot:Unigene14396_Nuclearia_a/m.43433 Unigene14396_Nuclearia_a/g.43433  ORF Unigene14396_Nuclearia_a/g.43433 Unigene14396_Nuclearia_a/m.43433 type:complete len:214 (-) Unigene14396_Nuclearia_a:43-684(-)
MMDETFLVNRVKEACCFVSRDVAVDLRLARRPGAANPIAQEYVLPDQATSKYGYVKTAAAAVQATDQVRRANACVLLADRRVQILVMNNERFTVPELLFRPFDIGIQHSGLCEAIVEAIEASPDMMRGLLYGNIVLVGGGANLPGIVERIQRDVRSMAPADYAVCVSVSERPSEAAFRGGVLFAGEPAFSRFCVTRQEYLEHGNAVCRKRFIL